SGPSPDLLVNAAGEIVRAINISVNGGQTSGPVIGDISVDQILNVDRGQALFLAGGIPATPLTNPQVTPLVTFVESYQEVNIENQSTLDLIINFVRVVNISEFTVEREVSLAVDDVDPFEFDVTHVW